MAKSTFFLSLICSPLLTQATPQKDASKHLNPSPVIGIMIQPVLDSSRDATLRKYGSMYLPASYVSFVEAAGARVAPVFWNSTSEERSTLFAQLSGLLIPGGHCGFHGTDYGAATNEMLDLAAKANADGDVFPVHGVCQGFQQISQWGADGTTSVLSKFDSENLNIALEPYEGTVWPPVDTQLFDGAPTEVSEALETNCTVNLHNYGVSLKHFAAGGSMDNGVLRPLAISRDRAGVPFISLLEGASLPFTGSQYHPEKNAFEFGGSWSSAPGIDDVRAEGAIAASQWIARRLVARARASGHRWKDTTAPTFSRIANGSCSDAGTEPINDQDVCALAAVALGLSVTTVAVSTASPRPEGCYWYSSSTSSALWFASSSDNIGNGATSTRSPICQSKQAVFPLMREFAPTPGGVDFDWERCYFWGTSAAEAIPEADGVVV